MNELKIFENEHFGQVRALEITGEPWFVAKDVCDILGLTNVTETLKRVEKDDLSTTEVIDSIGRKQRVYIINEYGLYDLIFLSRKPEAKAFKRWITHEVIPSIRKTGSYSIVDTSQLSPQLKALSQMLQVMAQQELRLNQVEDKLDVMQSNLLQEHKDDWREYVNKVLKAIGYKTGDYKTVRNKSYEKLEKRANCKMNVRLTNLKARALERGMTPSKVKSLNYLDILEDEPRLREIYLGIIREYAIKYEVDVRQPNRKQVV